MQVDPIGYSGGMNLYAYALNNPIMLIDPFGLCAESGWAAGLANQWDLYADDTREIMFGMSNGMGTIALATLTNTAVDLGAGMVDMLRLGEGVAEGGWGYGKDALRLAGFLGPAAKALQLARGGNTVAPSKTIICFAAGTSISTQDGDIPIEDITVGDKVFAFDFETNTVEIREVTQLQRGKTQAWILVEVNGQDTIKTTRFHQFWVESEQAWIEALELEPGMFLKLQSGQKSVITGIDVQFLDEYETTYNFEVEGLHNYYAGQQHVLVHNPTPQELLGIIHSNESAQAKLADRLLPNNIRVDIPENFMEPGSYPHAHGDGWSVNIDGTPHDAFKNKKSIPKKIKQLLRKAGWDC